MSKDTILQQMLEVMEQKETYAREILDLSKQQADVLESSSQSEPSDVSSLETILNKRQEYMKRVDELDMKLSSLKNSYPGPGMKEKENDISHIFSQIQETDNNNMGKLKELMSGLSTRIKSLQKAKASTNTYVRKKSQVQGFFVDKKK